MYLAYCVPLVGVKEMIGKGPEVFQKSRSSLKIFASQHVDLEQVTNRRHESIRRHRTKKLASKIYLVPGICAALS